MQKIGNKDLNNLAKFKNKIKVKVIILKKLMPLIV